VDDGAATGFRVGTGSSALAGLLDISFCISPLCWHWLNGEPYRSNIHLKHLLHGGGDFHEIQGVELQEETSGFYVKKGHFVFSPCLSLG